MPPSLPTGDAPLLRWRCCCASPGLAVAIGAELPHTSSSKGMEKTAVTMTSTNTDLVLGRGCQSPCTQQETGSMSVRRVASMATVVL